MADAWPGLDSLGTEGPRTEQLTKKREPEYEGDDHELLGCVSWEGREGWAQCECSPVAPVCAVTAGAVLPPGRPAGDEGRKLSPRASGFVRDPVAVRLTMNCLAHTSRVSRAVGFSFSKTRLHRDILMPPSKARGLYPCCAAAPSACASSGPWR